MDTEKHLSRYQQFCQKENKKNKIRQNKRKVISDCFLFESVD